MKKTVAVAMSGGVDSSVAALLLKERGYAVMGVTMETGFDGGQAVADAGRVARALGIDHHVLDLREEFRRDVVDYFTAEYLRGRTPNPCLVCNRKIKWGALLDRSLALGADYIATGHYAHVDRLPNGRFAVRNAAATGKDQSYALYALTQEQLERTIMPVGAYPKEEIRAMAARAGLDVANKPDSQDLCFVPDGDHAAFLDREAPDKVPGPGNFVDARGEVLGRHRGVPHYTVGQGKGLGIALGRHVYVKELRPETNEVVLGDDADVYARALDCDNLNFMGMADLKEPRRLLAKIRYSHPGAWCTTVQTGPDTVHVTFEEPVRAIAPGQAVVFYEDGYVMGGGTIL